MHGAGGGTVRLFYDGGCGPCSLFARASRGLSRGRVKIVPLQSLEADPDLGRLSPEVREGSFHLVAQGSLSSGEEALLPWLRATLGPSAAEGVRHVPPARVLMVRLYRRLWEERRRHGCGAAV